MLFGESDVDLVLAGLGGEVGRRAGTVSAVDARQLSLGRSLDRHRETTYVYRGTFGEVTNNRHAEPDYGIGIAGKYLRPTMSKRPMKDTCKNF